MGYKVKKIYIDDHQQIRPDKEWDLSKMTAEKLWNTGSTYIYYAYIDNSGLNFYTGQESGAVGQYTLSSPFDITNRTSIGSKSLGNGKQNIWFSKDGTLLFIRRYWTQNNVSKYPLTTAWDISTVQTQSEQTCTVIENSKKTTGGVISNNGSYMFTCDEGSKINLYSLSSPFDLSNPTFLGNVSAPQGITRGICLSNDGKHLFVGANSYILQLDLKSPYNLSNATWQQRSFSGTTYAPNNFYFASNIVNDNLLITADGRNVRTWKVI